MNWFDEAQKNKTFFFLEAKINDHEHILLPLTQSFAFFSLEALIIIYHSQTALISFQSGHDIQKYIRKCFSRERDLTCTSQFN